MDDCKLSISVGGFNMSGHYHDVCAMNESVRCEGTDDDKKRCPFWNSVINRGNEVV